MSLPWPRSLAGSMIALLLAALVAAHLIGLAAVVVQLRSGAETAERHVHARVVAVMRLLASSPASAHADIVRAGSSKRLRFALADRPAAPAGEPDAEGAAAGASLLEDLGLPASALRVGPVADGVRHLALRVPDGRWLSVERDLPSRFVRWAGRSLVALVLSGAALSVGIVVAARHITRPLTDLARAADALGRGEDVAALPERGPEDVRRVTRAFNDMRERLERFIGDRTRMLAAISHDLRTPITALRLRAELIDDAEQRDRILATLDEMQRTTEATFEFARDEAETEPARAVDLSALVESLCDDLRDVGMDVSYEGPDRLPVTCRPARLRRAIRNLVENAVRYGERARVRLRAETSQLVVTVDDDGPGIGATDRERCFEPFVRLETSRSQDTGGSGLGMAIARSIVRGHGGDIEIENRDRGLRATVRLPARAGAA